MSNRKPSDYLAQTASKLKAQEAEIARLDSKLVDQDIAARRIEADIGWHFAQEVDEIETALKAAGQKLNVDMVQEDPWRQCQHHAAAQTTLQTLGNLRGRTAQGLLRHLHLPYVLQKANQ